MFGRFFIDKKKKENFSFNRYTSSKDGQFVYASLLIWPKDTTEITLGAPISSGNTRITLLGCDIGPVTWRTATVAGGIIIDVSNIKTHSLASAWTWVFKLESVTGAQSSGVKNQKQSHK